MLILIRLITNKIEICLLKPFCCVGIWDLIWDLEFGDSRFWCEIRFKIWNLVWRFESPMKKIWDFRVRFDLRFAHHWLRKLELTRRTDRYERQEGEEGENMELGWMAAGHPRQNWKSLFLQKLLGGPKIRKLGHVTRATPTWGLFYNPYAGRVHPLCLYQICSR